MRRSIFAIAVFTSFALLACEDGPNDPYQPLSAGGGQLINNGNSTPVVDEAGTSFDASFPNISKTILCNPDQQHDTWSNMLAAPVIPPRIYAQLDMANGDQWQGMPVEKAESINCQGIPLGETGCPSGEGNSGCGGLYWGNNGEVVFWYNLETHIVDQMVLELGYLGHMRFMSQDMKSCYDVAIGQGPILKGTFDATKGFDPQAPTDDSWAAACGNQTPYLIHWLTGTRDADLTELYNAMMSTFAPDLLPHPATNCHSEGSCLVINDDGTGTAYFGVRPLAIYVNFIQNQPQPVPSTPVRFYNFYVKVLPYSSLGSTPGTSLNLELSATGPTAQGPVGQTQSNCNIKVGTGWQDFINGCVQVTGDPKLDQINYNKVTGNILHDYEHFTFNVVGVNQNFTDKALGQYEIVLDGQKPAATDVAEDWTFDVRSRGIPTNDGDANGNLDFHGSGMVVREWARLTMNDMAVQMQQYGIGNGTPTVLGDPTCIGTPTPAANCTGFEGLIIPGGPQPGDTAAMRRLYDPGIYGHSFLSPGDPVILFCYDPGTYKDCDPPLTQAFGGPVWDTALQHVIRTLGNGDVKNLPPEMRDRRYYFKFWGIALVKYLKAYGILGSQATPPQVAVQAYDPFSLFFDNSFGAQFDKVEYIDRDFLNVDANNVVPWDYEYGTDVKTANQRYDNWYRRMDREETAMYESMLVDKTHKPGQENNVMLTNMFGSPLLTAYWDSYVCATTGADATHPCNVNSFGITGANLPPPQAINPVNGTIYPLFQFYPGAWGKTIFSMGHSPIKINEEDLQILGVKAHLPNFLNPYAACAAQTKDANGTVICDPNDATYVAMTPNLTDVLVPYYPSSPGSGFEVPFDGTRSLLIQTATLDFTGVLETYYVDYEYWKPKDGANCNADSDCASGLHCDTQHFQPAPQAAGQCTDNTINIDAIECHDFLGDVFLCVDPESGDILHTGMYGAGYTILNWIASHPQAQNACGLLVRYSAYNNYPDFISSTAYGVTVSMNQGQGDGRVVDATLFNPVFESASQ